MKKIFPLSILLFILTSCHRYYTSSGFYQKTSHHKIIAVVPAEMIFTGNLGKNISLADIQKVEEAESKAFQQALHDNILKNAHTKNYDMDVTVQHYTNTLDLLAKNNISIRNSWSQPDETLTRILGVDAIVRLKVQKNRYMSDLASLGIGLGRQLINIISPSSTILTPNNKTNDIITSCSIVSGGETLWNDNYKRASDWNTPANQVIENITNNFAKHIPYRKRK